MPTDTFEAAKSLFLQGLAELQDGRLRDAERSFEASLARVPGRASTLVNLAAVRLALGRPREALAAADEAFAKDATNADAALHRADALRQLSRHAEAAQAYDTLLALRGDLPLAWFHRGVCLLEAYRHPDALVCFDRALALDPALHAAWSCRGDILRDMGRLENAREAYQRALAHGADAELTAYCLAGLGGGDAPATAPRAYVEQLFDAYAADFEQHVVQALHYQGPARLVEALATLHPQRFARAVDLGCGTGLCGPLLRPRVERLTGVDLSRRMLDQAHERGAYDEVVQADVAAYLREAEAPVDLVVAADVFIYVGALDEVFAQVARLMPAGGIFCFSAEQSRPGVAAGFELLPSLRYAHDEAYLRGLAEAHGFEVARLAHETVREEQRQPIPGMFVHLRRGGPRSAHD